MLNPSKSFMSHCTLGRRICASSKQLEDILQEDSRLLMIAQAMVDIPYKHNLQHKVTRTKTDNGSSFVKAFVQFGTDAELLPDVAEAASTDLDAEDVKDGGQDGNHEAGDVEDIECISVDDILNESSSLGLKLAVYMRCAAHTLNLIASVDATNTLESTAFKFCLFLLEQFNSSEFNRVKKP
ncbi:hypothetical protein CRENBAI_001210 [Crenichthys baileyi]|uniref:Uncharacterized protein n=1 Tax=Crenichthys baileyi TaxID=28760 RepID=A0AAV9R1A0_9TELE